jgi:hypothetical protein
MAVKTKPKGEEKSIKAGTELARHAFLYGGPDGVPVISKQLLADMAGVHPTTIGAHLPAWTRQREELLRQREENPLGYILSPETVEQNRKDVEFLRLETDKLKLESENLVGITDKLYGVLENLSENLDLGPDDADKIIGLVGKYLGASANRSKVLTLFLAVQKRWQESSGIASSMKSFEAGQREAEKGKARIAAKEKEIALLNDGALEIVTTPALGVFARKKNAGSS